MNEVITKLYEIEAKAGQILEDKRLQKEKIREQMEKEEKAYEAGLREEMEQQLIRAKNNLDDRTNLEISELTEHYQKHKSSLDQLCKTHLEEIAKDIFERMTEVS